MQVYKLLIIGLGGAIGSIGRYLMVRLLDHRLSAILPFGTLAVNVVGSFLLGILYMHFFRKTDPTQNLWLFLGVGICGGFTTFSAFALENFNFIDQKMLGISLLYISLSVIAGVLSFGAGVWVSRFF